MQPEKRISSLVDSTAADIAGDESVNNGVVVGSARGDNAPACSVMNKDSEVAVQNVGNTLFVFYIPSVWDDNDLKTQFEPFGAIDSCRVCRKPDRSSRGYGFVKFQESGAAIEAINSMNGLDVGENKRLKVQFKSASSEKTGYHANTPGRSHPLPGCTIFVFHLPSDWSDAGLKQHFSHFGRITQCTVQRDGAGKSKGFGFVSFEKPSSAVNAINGMNGFSAGSKFLKVTLKKGEEHYVRPAAAHPVYVQSPFNYAPPSQYHSYIHCTPYPSASGLVNRSPYGASDMSYPAPHLSNHAPTPPPPYYSAPPPPMQAPPPPMIQYHHMHQLHRNKRPDELAPGPSAAGQPPPPISHHTGSGGGTIQLPGQPGGVLAGAQGSAGGAGGTVSGGSVVGYYGAQGGSQQAGGLAGVGCSAGMGAVLSSGYLAGGMTQGNNAAGQGAGVYDYASNAAAFTGQWNLQLG